MAIANNSADSSAAAVSDSSVQIEDLISKFKL